MGRRIRRWREGKERTISFFCDPEGVYRVKLLIDDVDHQDRYHTYNLVDKVFDKLYNFNLGVIRNIRIKRCRGTLNKFCVTFTMIIKENSLKYYKDTHDCKILKLEKIK